MKVPLFVLCCFLLALHARGQTHVATTSIPPETGPQGGNPIYADGVQNGWTVSVLGAVINDSDTSDTRAGTNVSLKAAVKPFGSVYFTSAAPFNASASVLDLWLRGSALGRASLSLQDLRAGRTSETLLIPISPSAVDPSIARLIGPDESGWYRLQVNLAALTTNASIPVPPLSPDLWDAIYLKDVSGLGYDVTISELTLVPTSTAENGTSPSACIGDACSPLLKPASIASPLVPLYGGSVSASSISGPAPVIARLEPGTTVAEVAKLCAEMGGHLQGNDSSPFNGPGFNGKCILDSPVSVMDVNGSAPVSWPFISIIAQSEADLQAMRVQLVGTVAYFDRDKNATINSRSLQSVSPVPEPSSEGNTTIQQLQAAADGNASLPTSLPLPQPTSTAANGSQTILGMIIDVVDSLLNPLTANTSSPQAEPGPTNDSSPAPSSTNASSSTIAQNVATGINTVANDLADFLGLGPAPEVLNKTGVNGSSTIAQNVATGINTVANDLADHLGLGPAPEVLNKTGVNGSSTIAQNVATGINTAANDLADHLGLGPAPEVLNKTGVNGSSTIAQNVATGINTAANDLADFLGLGPAPEVLNKTGVNGSSTIAQNVATGINTVANDLADHLGLGPAPEVLNKTGVNGSSTIAQNVATGINTVANDLADFLGLGPAPEVLNKTGVNGSSTIAQNVATGINTVANDLADHLGLGPAPEVLNKTGVNGSSTIAQNVATGINTAANDLADFLGLGPAPEVLNKTGVNGSSTIAQNVATGINTVANDLADHLGLGPAPEGSNQTVNATASIEETCPAVGWNLDRIDQASLPLNGIYDPVNTGSGSHVYILDTGLLTTNQDFAGRVGQGADCTSGTCLTDVPITDGNGHGTHTSGTAVGTCYGVAKKAIIHPVKVLGSDGSGSFSNIIAGIHWVINNVAANGHWPAVISMSLGGDRSQSLDDAVQEAVNQGIPVVVAAGNNFGADACTQSPAGAPAAITVGASDRQDHAAPFSNIGSCLDIWAPGVDIVSDWNTGDTATMTLSGTSMATPAVAGVVALLLEDGKAKTTSDARSNLNSAAVDINFNSQSTNRFVQAQASRING